MNDVVLPGRLRRLDTTRIMYCSPWTNYEETGSTREDEGSARLRHKETPRPSCEHQEWTICSFNSSKSIVSLAHLVLIAGSCLRSI